MDFKKILRCFLWTSVLFFSTAYANFSPLTANDAYALSVELQDHQTIVVQWGTSRPDIIY